MIRGIIVVVRVGTLRSETFGAFACKGLLETFFDEKGHHFDVGSAVLLILDFVHLLFMRFGINNYVN